MENSEFSTIPLRMVNREKCRVAMESSNFDKNRYPDVLPPDSTRVKLDNEGKRYINASFIRMGKKKRAIACQAPLLETIDDFWFMIYKYKVPIIVMLSNLIENGKVKCDSYWPCFHSMNLTLDDFSFTVSVNSITLEEGNITMKFFEINPLGNKDPYLIHNVLHIHYTGWPDGDVPEDEEFIENLRVIWKFWNSYKKPSVFHCSAGIGRTGTLLALLKCIRCKMFDIHSVVSSLREDRHGMVQTPEQYAFIKRILDKIKNDSYFYCPN